LSVLRHGDLCLGDLKALYLYKVDWLLLFTSVLRAHREAAPSYRTKLNIQARSIDVLSGVTEANTALNAIDTGIEAQFTLLAPHDTLFAQTWNLLITQTITVIVQAITALLFWELLPLTERPAPLFTAPHSCLAGSMLFCPLSPLIAALRERFSLCIFIYQAITIII